MTSNFILVEELQKQKHNLYMNSTRDPILSLFWNLFSELICIIEFRKRDGIFIHPFFPIASLKTIMIVIIITSIRFILTIDMILEFVLIRFRVPNSSIICVAKMNQNAYTICKGTH